MPFRGFQISTQLLLNLRWVFLDEITTGLQYLPVEAVSFQYLGLACIAELFFKLGDDGNIAAGKAKNGLPVIPYRVKFYARILLPDSFNEFVPAQRHVLEL